jgi:hypothetical protein
LSSGADPSLAKIFRRCHSTVRELTSQFLRAADIDIADVAVPGVDLLDVHPVS